MRIFIKNMACLSCIHFVKGALDELGIVTISVVMGEVETKEDISDDQKREFGIKINIVGLELLEGKQGILVGKIRKVMLEYVNLSDGKSDVNFSSHLSEELNHSYSYLSNLFSEVECTTIHQSIILLKIERAKEMILHEDYSLSEIAYKLQYSSTSYFTNQFKQITGLLPSHFKKLKEKRRIPIRDI